MRDLAWEKQTKKLAGSSFIDKEPKEQHKGISGTHGEFITMKRER